MGWEWCIWTVFECWKAALGPIWVLGWWPKAGTEAGLGRDGIAGCSCMWGMPLVCNGCCNWVDALGIGGGGSEGGWEEAEWSDGWGKFWNWVDCWIGIVVTWALRGCCADCKGRDWLFKEGIDVEVTGIMGWLGFRREFGFWDALIGSLKSVWPGTGKAACTFVCWGGRAACCGCCDAGGGMFGF